MAAQSAGDPIAHGFLNPPDDAKPRVWWHWMGANITKEGIEKDLEWMKRVGIGGFQNFEGNLGVPQVVEKPIGYMTPEWKDAFRFAMQTAERLGLEGAVASSPGWSETGGPWVKPEQAMKKYVFMRNQNRFSTICFATTGLAIVCTLAARLLPPEPAGSAPSRRPKSRKQE